MPGVCGLKVVERAKAYAAEHPHAPTLQVIDYAMQGNYNTHIAFEYDGPEPWDDWLHPPSPFASLLHHAACTCLGMTSAPSPNGGRTR